MRTRQRSRVLLYRGYDASRDDYEITLRGLEISRNFPLYATYSALYLAARRIPKAPNVVPPARAYVALRAPRALITRDGGRNSAVVHYRAIRINGAARDRVDCVIEPARTAV